MPSCIIPTCRNCSRLNKKQDGITFHVYEPKLSKRHQQSSMSADKEEEETQPEHMEEAGALEADVGARFDQQLASIDPRLQINQDPYAHRDLRPEMMFIREELRQAKMQTLAVRRTALKKLLLRDFMQEDCELRNIGLAYAPQDP